MGKLGRFVQTPDEVKRYTIDYSDWLDTGETITAVTSEVDNVTTPPMAVTDTEFTDTTVTFFVGGGTDGEKYDVIIRADTSTGQVVDEWIMIAVKDPAP